MVLIVRPDRPQSNHNRLDDRCTFVIDRCEIGRCVSRSIRITVDLDPAHLRSFDAVVRHGGYHRAADALHLTQPAVSRHIRRLEEQLGEPLFRKRGRGVELTEFGAQAAEELADVLQAHDRAIARLLREGQAPFAFGVVDHLSEPLLPALLAVLRGQLGARELRLRVDRSRTLTESFGRGELDAALVMDPYGSPHAAALGELTLRWWTAAAIEPPRTLPARVPLVAYESPCSFREQAIGRIRELGSEPLITAEAPHFSGVATAARNGLGYALLPSGGDGLRAISHGPLAETLQAPLWLLVSPTHAELAAPMRTAMSATVPERRLTVVA
jgi:DNA-binding transcriptional LysR family regulator